MRISYWSSDVCSSDLSSIVLHGGGNFGDLYPIHQEFRERIVEQFPRNRIVIMPQSIHFKNPARLAEAARRFAAHRNLTTTVRDLDSERLVREHFSNPVHLVPDMAHQIRSEERRVGTECVRTYSSRWSPYQ